MATIESYSDEFDSLVGSHPQLHRLGSGFEFLEGPCWYTLADGLVFSDIPADCIYFWSEKDGISEWRKPSNHANGNTLDNEGRLLTCEHGKRRVIRTEFDGSFSVVCDSYQGRKLNSPNDIICQRDGTIWFTDPPYGIEPDEMEQPHSYVFRVGKDGNPEAVADDFVKPNGLSFSPDETLFFVSDTDNERHHIRRFDVLPNKQLVGGEVFKTISPGKSDGFRIDPKGRLFTSAGDGIWIMSSDAQVLGKVLVPETPSNCAFGGPNYDTLFITARTSLYAIELKFLEV